MAHGLTTPLCITESIKGIIVKKIHVNKLELKNANYKR